MCTTLLVVQSFGRVINLNCVACHTMLCKFIENNSEEQRKYTNQIILFANYCCHRSQESSLQAFCLEIDFASVPDDGSVSFTGSICVQL